MRITRFPVGVSAADIRALTPPPRDVEDAVRAIIDDVREGGDEAVRALTERLRHSFNRSR